jgi:hypothetical protein
MSDPQPWFVAERAEHLAMMHLTRRDDLRVMPRPGGCGIDLLVTIMRDGIFSGRQFGVVIKARMGGHKPPRMDARTVAREREHFRDVPFPVVMLFFSLDTDRGYCRWIVEPAGDDAAPMLEMPEQMLMWEMHPSSLDVIVERVNAWYDARTR